jgi:protein-ribulosamine 3-kinase
MSADKPKTELELWLEQEENTHIVGWQTLSGGDICRTQVITTDDGRRFCVKHQSAAPEDFFAAEAEGLAALRRNGNLRVPHVYAFDKTFIALEYIPPGSQTAGYWTDLGAQLARLHSDAFPRFGFTRDNYCGRTLQPNPRYDNGYDFFVQERLLYQGKLALEYGHLAADEMAQLERLCARLPELIPEQHPALLHGDLWAGNIHSDLKNRPVLIDPACYWGWPEADLAMTRLFGGFDTRFYHSYQQVRPLEPGWEERVPIYNLYHLLNHLNLFGSSYHSQVTMVLSHFT